MVLPGNTECYCDSAYHPEGHPGYKDGQEHPAVVSRRKLALRLQGLVHDTDPIKIPVHNRPALKRANTLLSSASARLHIYGDGMKQAAVQNVRKARDVLASEGYNTFAKEADELGRDIEREYRLY